MLGMMPRAGLKFALRDLKLHSRALTNPRATFTANSAANKDNGRNAKSWLRYFPSDNLARKDVLAGKMPIPTWLELCENSDRCDIPMTSTPKVLQEEEEGQELIPGFVIQRISKSNLRLAQELLYHVFPEDSADYEITFAALQKPYLCHDHLTEIISTDAWLVVDKSNGKAAATLGIYYTREDFKDVVWGNWFAVSPSYRGQGLGAATIIHTFKNCILHSGKMYGRLYTDEVKTESKAHSLYEMLGFKTYKDDTAFGLKRCWYQVTIGGYRKYPLLVFCEITSWVLAWRRFIRQRNIPALSPRAS